MIKLKLIFLLTTVFVVGIAKADLLTDAASAYVKGEFKRAAVIFESLAEKGNVMAQTVLGIMYKEGQGVQKNIPEAIRWFSLAEKQGFAPAQTALGFMFMSEDSFQNYKKAKELLLLAAGQADSKAMFGLGFLYFKGRGVPFDPIRAYMWFNIVMLFEAEESILDQDDINIAKDIRTKLTKVMSSDQINEAQELSMRCVMKKLKNC